MAYTYESLLRENEELREENRKLKHELDLRGGKPDDRNVILIRGRRKGTGACYDIRRLNYQHRKILHTLLMMGAISEKSSAPAVGIRQKAKVGQGPMAGRIAELIRKGYIISNRVRVLFQPDAEGSWQFRPESAYDPSISARRRRRFAYYITDAGKRALIAEVQPSDDFAKADIGPLLEIRKEVERKAKEGDKVEA